MKILKNGSEKNSSSNVSLLDKYGLNTPLEKSAKPQDEEVVLDDHGAFGVLRGARERAIMLELIGHDGTITALAYAWLDRAIFEPSVGITLFFGHSLARITGRNLHREIRPNLRLFDALVRQRVPWIKEADETMKLDAEPKDVIIETIMIEA
ncbi:hypothetical protein K2Y11_09665 [bacterium]|nr:hypothetical protein [bacterium]